MMKKLLFLWLLLVPSFLAGHTRQKVDSAFGVQKLCADKHVLNAGLQLDIARYAQSQKEYQTAETCYLRALWLYRRLAISNPLVHEPHVAETLCRLGEIYTLLQRFDESRNRYEEAIEMWRRVVSSAPLSYEPRLAETLNSLAVVYEGCLRYEESEAMYKEVVEIWRRFAISNPLVYEPMLAQSYFDLGMLYTRAWLPFGEAVYTSDGKMVKHLNPLNAIPYFEAALEIYKKRAAESPIMQEQYSTTLVWLERMYRMRAKSH